MKITHLLLIEDEEAIRDMLRFALPSAEFHLTTTENTTQATHALAEQIPQLMIVDWMLPGKSGIDFIKWVRQQPTLKHIPIILLTARAEEEHKVKGLLAGADDYITKPFSPQELIARIKTILRRGPLLAVNNEIKVADLSLNTEQCRVSIGKQSLALSPIEYNMLLFFMSHPDKTYSRDQLITHVWGTNIYIDDRTVDVQIRRLRDKLKPYGHHERIKTIRGSGYLFIKDSDEKN